MDFMDFMEFYAGGRGQMVLRLKGKGYHGYDPVGVYI